MLAAWSRRYKALTEALAELLEDYNLISFQLLCITVGRLPRARPRVSALNAQVRRMRTRSRASCACSTRRSGTCRGWRRRSWRASTATPCSRRVAVLLCVCVCVCVCSRACVGVCVAGAVARAWCAVAASLTTAITAGHRREVFAASGRWRRGRVIVHVPPAPAPPESCTAAPKSMARSTKMCSVVANPRAQMPCRSRIRRQAREEATGHSAASAGSVLCQQHAPSAGR